MNILLREADLSAEDHRENVALILPADDALRPRVKAILETLASLGDGALVWDKSFHLIGCNQMACRMMGLAPSDVSHGQSFHAVRKLIACARGAQSWFRDEIADVSLNELSLAQLQEMFHAREVMPRLTAFGPAMVHRSVIDDEIFVSTLRAETVADPSIGDERIYLRTIFEHMSDGVLMVDADKRVNAYNRRILELYDMNPDDVAPGMPIAEFTRANGDLKTLSEIDAERAISERLSVITPGVPGTTKLNRQLANGRVLELTRISLPLGSIIITVRDATQTMELARQRFLIETVIRNIDEGVSLIEPDGTYGVFNERMLELYGIDARKVKAGDRIETFARACGDLDRMSPEEAEAEVRSRIEFATTSEPGTVKLSRRLANGRIIEVSRTGIEGGGAVATYRDVTREIEQSKQLSAAKAAAEEASQMKSEFIAKVTHDLRTPIQGLLGMAMLLKQTELDDQQLRYLSVLDSSGRHMVNLVDSLLTISTLDAGELKLETEETNLRDLMRECADMIGMPARDKGLRLNLYIELPEEAVVIADHTRLKQVIVNLLSNAVKFTEAGTVRLSASSVYDGERLHLDVSVSDTGPGIPPDQLESIFGKFCQADSTNRVEGVGLGLSIARSLTQLMGGKLSVTSALGEGATFTLSLSFEAA